MKRVRGMGEKGVFRGRRRQSKRVRGLAATGDFLRAVHSVAEAFEDFYHADAGARKERVHKARDEKRDGHAWP